MEKEEQMRKAQLLSIIEWLKTTDEFKKVEWTNEASIFYHVAPNTYAELILKYKHEWYKKLLNKLRLINQGDELNLLDYIEEVKNKISDTAAGCSAKNNGA